MNDLPNDSMDRVHQLRGDRARRFASMLRSRQTAGMMLAGAAIPLFLIAWPTPTSGVPRIPGRDEEVLERLPSAQSMIRGRSPERQRIVAEVPSSEAIAEARRLLELARAESDPRYLGRAQAFLSPWIQRSNPPAPVRLMRAIMRQSTHDFNGALDDLQACLRESTNNAQAWLVKSTIHTVRGEWQAAREAALALTPLTDRLVSASLAASIASLNGQAAEARQLLTQSLASERNAAPAVRLWARTLLAETCERLGEAAAAETHFQTALRMGIRDAYLRGAYADFLLAEDRAAEVVTLLDDPSLSDGLLLRLALAEQRLNPQSEVLATHVRTLAQRFESARRRGEAIHQREEAIFEWKLRQNPARALQLAQANWAVQREPCDAKILLESALAMRHIETVKQIQQWLNDSGLEDVRLRRLLAEPGAQP